MVFSALSSGCLLHGYRDLRVFTQIKKFVYNYLRIHHHTLRNLSKPSVVCAETMCYFVLFTCGSHITSRYESSRNSKNLQGFKTNYAQKIEKQILKLQEFFDRQYFLVEFFFHSKLFNSFNF